MTLEHTGDIQAALTTDLLRGPLEVAGAHVQLATTRVADDSRHLAADGENSRHRTILRGKGIEVTKPMMSVVYYIRSIRLLPLNYPLDKP